MAPGARSKFGAPIFVTEVFRKQMYKKILVTIVRTFRRPRSDSTPREFLPLVPLTPLHPDCGGKFTVASSIAVAEPTC